MKRTMPVVSCLTLLLAALACASPVPTPNAAPPHSEPTQTQIASTQAAPPGDTPLPPATAQPTQGEVSFPTPTRIVPQAGPTSGGVNRVKIYLVALADGGKSGVKIGCDDSLVAVDRDIEPTQAPLTAALNELFALKDQFYGQSGLYNALYTSDLTVAKVTIDANGLATILLTGTISLAGECDDPRFQGQIEYTARQFSTVKDLAVFINGQPLAQVIGLK